MKHSVYVVGEAKAQPRARSTHFRKKGVDTSRVYTPASAGNWKYAVSIGLTKIADAVGHPIDDACRVDVHIFFERPESHWRHKQAYKVLKGNAPIYHTRKPDRDNVDKLILDAGKNVGLFSDDCRVALGEIVKKYATHEPPGCLITISTDIGPLTVGELYSDDLLDLTKNPRRVPANASVIPGAFSRPTAVPMIKEA